MAVTTGIKRKIYDYCSNFDTLKVIFLNRYGTYETCYFNKGTKRKLNIQRNEFNRNLAYNYSIGDRGRTLYSLKVIEEWTYISDWMDEYEYNFYEQLVSTIEGYVIIENVKYPIIIKNPSWDEKHYYDKDLFNLELVFEFAYNKPTLTQ